MRKPFKIVLGVLAMTCIMSTVGQAVHANNHTDTPFDFEVDYCAGTDQMVDKPRRKMDNTASYVKLTAKSDDAWPSFRGTNSSTNYTLGLDEETGSSSKLRAGNYRYISNSAYPKYKYTYLMLGSNDNRVRFIGRWSPDNISGRY
ncbi:hypothetical protein [Candidatus Weimeria sp. HCP3S3_B5]|uniref:hypothetical protein n=1 Tax=Candidatus Weimeria sp. HCP3S3_B5 TaxID=3438871 RepID=UPI003034738A|nr:hypothetical protein [Lachnospiraceae bacterium]